MSKHDQNSDTIGKRVIKLVMSGFFFSGNWPWRQIQRLAGRKVPGTCVVLYYHAVPNAHRAKFAKQMDVLIRCSTPVKPEIKDALESGVHHTAIIFPDAFTSACENALPELAQRGIPSTLFVPSGYLGHRQGWITDESHSDFKETVIDASRLKALDSNLVSVGSHSVTHADFSLLSETEAKEELGRSKSDLERVLGRPVKLFAFPYGSCTKALMELPRQMGYQRAFTIEPELAFSEPDEFVTGACSVSPTDWALEFRLKVLGAYHWLPIVYRLKRKAALIMRKRPFRNGHDARAVTGDVLNQTRSSDARHSAK
jgi:peptidoglycan/xylan/chitin deacetylase (PgdA/CDA1 family)